MNTIKEVYGKLSQLRAKKSVAYIVDFKNYEMIKFNLFLT